MYHLSIKKEQVLTPGVSAYNIRMSYIVRQFIIATLIAGQQKRLDQ